MRSGAVDDAESAEIGELARRLPGHDEEGRREQEQHAVAPELLPDQGIIEERLPSRVQVVPRGVGRDEPADIQAPQGVLRKHGRRNLVIGKWVIDLDTIELLPAARFELVASEGSCGASAARVPLEAVEGSAAVILTHTGEVFQTELVLDRENHDTGVGQAATAAAQQFVVRIAGSGRELCRILEDTDHDHEVELRAEAQLLKRRANNVDVLHVARPCARDAGSARATFDRDDSGEGLTEEARDGSATAANLEDALAAREIETLQQTARAGV